MVKKVSKDTIGHIVNQASPTPPDSRYLECDGSAIDSAVYPELWSMTEESINFNTPNYEKDAIGSGAGTMFGSVGRFFKFDGKICKFINETTLIYSSDKINWSTKKFTSLTLNYSCRVQVLDNELVVLIPTTRGFKIWHWPSFSSSASTITVTISDYSSASAYPAGIGYINGKYVVITTQASSSSIITRVVTTDDWRTASGWAVKEISGYPNMGFADGYGPVTISGKLYFIVFTAYFSSDRAYLIYTSDGNTFSYTNLSKINLSDLVTEYYTVDYHDSNVIYLSTMSGYTTLKINVSDGTIEFAGTYYNYIHDLQIGMVVNSQKSAFSTVYPREIVKVSIEDDTVRHPYDFWRISETPFNECRMAYFDSILYIYIQRDSANAGTSYIQGLIQTFNVGKFLPYIDSPSHHFIKAKENF